MGRGQSSRVDSLSTSRGKVMATLHPSQQTPAAESWAALSRQEEVEGERRANLLRIAGILAFYTVELVNYHGLNLGFIEMPQVTDRPFHLAVTLLAVVWCVVCLAVLYCRTHGIVLAALKFLSTGC